MIVAEDLKDFVSNSPMFFDRLGKDEDVIHAYNYYPMANESMKQIVHHRLKGSRRIDEAKEHD